MKEKEKFLVVITRVKRSWFQSDRKDRTRRVNNEDGSVKREGSQNEKKKRKFRITTAGPSSEIVTSGPVTLIWQLSKRTTVTDKKVEYDYLLPLNKNYILKLGNDRKNFQTLDEG